MKYIWKKCYSTKIHLDAALSRDLERLKVNTCCAQETKILKVGTIIRHDHLIWLESDVAHYGTGFMNTKKWLKNIYKYLKRNGCIAVTQFIQNYKKQTNKKIQGHNNSKCLCLKDSTPQKL